MDHYEAVLEFFNKADKPIKAGEVAKGTGIERKEVDKAMNRLKKEGKIVSPKHCFWEKKS